MHTGQSLRVSSLGLQWEVKNTSHSIFAIFIIRFMHFLPFKQKNVLFAFLLAKSPYTKSGLTTRSLLLVSYRYLLFITMFD